MPSTSSRGGAPMRQWLPLAVGSGLLLAGCTESRGPTQPAVRGVPSFDATHGQRHRTHVMEPRGQNHGRHGGQGGGYTGILYHGGPIIYNQNVAAIYWSGAPIYNGGPTPGSTGSGSADGSLVGLFMSNLGGSSYFNINTTYFDGSNTPINNVVNYTQYWASNTNLPPTDYSPLSDDAIIAQIELGFSSGALTYDPSTLYIVFTGIGVNPGGGFGTVYCAYHGYYIAADGRNVKYSAMPYAVDPAYPGACSALSESWAVRVPPRPPACALHAPHPPPHHAADVGHRAAERAVHRIAHALEDVVHHVAMLVQELAARVGDLIHLLPFHHSRVHEPLVFEPLQRGVDRPRRGRVTAVQLLLQLLHHLVAVARLVLEQLEDHVLHVARREPLAAAAPGTPPEEAARAQAEGECVPSEMSTHAYPPFELVDDVT